jgi:hypothetical protein
MAETLPALMQELQTFERHKAELLARAEYKYALIKGDEVLGTFETQQDAINSGYRQLGVVPFLVKQVVLEETPVNFSMPFKAA